MHFKRLKSASVVLFFSITAMLLNGCASTREFLDLETSMFLKFRVSESVNPDSNGRASPIVINLFYLTDNRQFEQEDIISLLQDADDRLGKDMIDKARLKEFIPGEDRDKSMKLSKKVKYVGILAEYIQYEKANAKLLIPIEAHTKNTEVINVDRLAVSKR